MITILPDQSYHLPVTDDIASSKNNRPEAEKSTIELNKVELQSDRRVLSWTNILLGLVAIFLIAGTLYFYLPQARSQNKIKDTQTSLFDISNLKKNEKLDGGSGYIQNPNDGSSTGATYEGKPPGKANDKASKPSKPISRTISDTRKTIIGDDQPPEDDESGDDEDPNKKKKKKLNEDLALSDSQQDQEDELSDDDEELASDLEDEEMNWMLPISSEVPPLVGSTAN